MSLPMAIAQVLRATDRKACKDKANLLEGEKSLCYVLHLRDLDLTPDDAVMIAKELRQANRKELSVLQSISISNNPTLGSDGVIPIIEALPRSICEIGMVNCGMDDVCGRRLLDWMEEAPDLQMVCIEGNNFSQLLKSSFTQFSGSRSNLLLIL